MLQFQPPGFGQRVVQTSLGSMVYYTPVDSRRNQSLPTLIFLHNFGGGAWAYEWSKVYPAFTDRYCTIAPDLIGWGQSAHPVRNYCVDDYLVTLREFIQNFPLPVTVVASSLTGAIAVRLAIQNPELFRALILVCPSGFDDFGQSAGRRLPLSAIATPLLDRLIYTLGAENELAVQNFLQQFLFANPARVSAEMVAAYLASAQQPNAIYAALAFLRGDLYFDLALYISQLKVPTAIFWGEKAQFTRVEIGRRLVQLNPNAIHIFDAIAATGVLPHLEMPEVFIGLLQRHLQILSTQSEIP